MNHQVTPNQNLERFRRASRYLASFVVSAVVFLTLFPGHAMAQAPCCQITAIDQQSGAVVGKVKATDELFEFRVTNAALRKALKAGQAIYANFKTRQVSLDGKSPCCTIISVSPVPQSTSPAANASGPAQSGQSSGLGRSAVLGKTYIWTRWGHVVSTGSAPAMIALEARLKPPAAMPFAVGTVAVTAANYPIGAGGQTASVSAGGELIRFNLAQSIATNLFPGQQVWTNALNQAMVVKFPIVTEQNDDLGNGFHMDTVVKISKNGELDATTRTVSYNCLEGVEGGVTVFILDDQGNTLYHTDPPQHFGVNGNCFPSSDRTDQWYATVPSDVLAQAAGVKISQINFGGSHWDDFVQKAKDLLGIIGTAVSDYQKISGGGATSGTGTGTGGASGSNGSTPKAPKSLRP